MATAVEVAADPTVYIPKKPVFKQCGKIHVPRKSEYSFWAPHKDPHKIYKGNLDHWSKQRIAGYMYVAKKKKKLGEEDLDIVSGDRPWVLPERPFDEECVELLEKLGSMRPGQLSKGRSKSIQREWLLGGFYSHAKVDFEYWPFDKDTPFVSPQKEKKLITSITALPPHNLVALMKAAHKPKKQMKTNIEMFTKQ